jgi:hypothetical protein
MGQIKFMDSKSCYIVIGYAPTPQKQLTLISLLNKLNENGVDTILVLHSKPTEEMISISSYVVYDKNNEIYNTFPTKSEPFSPRIIEIVYGPPGMVIGTAYASNLHYHGIAAASLLYHGLAFAKTLGYEYAHVIEYDTEVPSISEFEENERLFADGQISSVYYHIGPHPSMIYVQCASYNLNYYSPEELAWSTAKDNIKSVANADGYGINNGMVEVAIFELLHANKFAFQKTLLNLTNNGIDIDLSYSRSLDPSDLVLLAPYMSSDTQVCIFGLYKKQVTDKQKNIRINVNGNDIHRTLIDEGAWFYVELCHINDLQMIELYVNDTLTRKYDFINEIDIEHFKNNSKLF